MQAWMIQIMGQYGALGIFLLIFAENVFPPIPSEVILAFGGFMTLQTPLSVGGAVLAATLGSVAGALVLYGAGRWVGQRRLIRFVRRHGKILGLKETNVQRALACYRRAQNKAVFFCRMAPIVRSLISLPAGMARMPMGRFLLLTALGSALWNTALVYAGRALGHAWSGIGAFTDTYAMLLWGAALALGAAWLWRRKRRAKREAA